MTIFFCYYCYCFSSWGASEWSIRNGLSQYQEMDEIVPQAATRNDEDDYKEEEEEIIVVVDVLTSQGWRCL